MALGYIPVAGENDEIDILSSEGEVICRMDDGVEYVPRFGKITLRDRSGPASDEKKEE